MKKLLSIIGATTLITSGSSNLIACNNKLFNNKLSSEELEKLKSENSKTLDGTKLEWIAPQENPFKSNDNKIYYVIWKGENNWIIVKFENNFNRDFAWSQKNLDRDGKYNLFLSVEAIVREENVHNMPSIFENWNDNPPSSVDLNIFKGVYRWDGNGIDSPNLKIDNNGNIII